MHLQFPLKENAFIFKLVAHFTQNQPKVRKASFLKAQFVSSSTVEIKTCLIDPIWQEGRVHQSCPWYQSPPTANSSLGTSECLHEIGVSSLEDRMFSFDHNHHVQRFWRLQFSFCSLKTQRALLYKVESTTGPSWAWGREGRPSRRSSWPACSLETVPRSGPLCKRV